LQTLRDPEEVRTVIERGHQLRRLFGSGQRSPLARTDVHEDAWPLAGRR